MSSGLALLLLCTFYVVSLGQEAETLELGKTVSATLAPKSWKYYTFKVENDDTLKFEVSRAAVSGQDIVYIRKGALPTKIDFDEIDTASGRTHAIQFSPSTGVYYFGILNVALRVTSTYNVTLKSLASKQPILTWEGEPFEVCEGISPPMYGPPSLAIGLSSFSVACARKSTKPRAVVEFRRFNGNLLRSDPLRTPRASYFTEPAVEFVQGTYQVASSWENVRYLHINLRSYEQDGTLIQNQTTWGPTYIPDTRDDFPNLIWNGDSTLFVFWHLQYEWYTVYKGFFDLRGIEQRPSHSLYEPLRNGDGDGLHPSRLRAVWNPYVAEEDPENTEVAFFTWDGGKGRSRKLEFSIQTDDITPIKRYPLVGADTWINVTDGGLDMAITSNNEYVLVHPVTNFGTLQVTLMSREGEMLKVITVKHTAKQPNLLTIDDLIFLTTENNGVGYVTVLSNTLEIIAMECIGGGSGRTMYAPILYYDPTLDMTMVLYTTDDGVAMVQRLTMTLPAPGNRK